MDMSLLDHRRLSGDYDSSPCGSSSNNHASCYSVASHKRNITGISNTYSAGIANGKGEAADSLKTFKTHNTSASSGFSAATSPTTGSYTGGRRGPIIGQVFRGGNVAFANSRADDDNNGFHDNTNLSDNDDDGDNSFVGNLGSRNDTLRASDHLFLSDEIFTSPSLRCLSITSREPDALPCTGSVDGRGDMRNSPDGRSDGSICNRPIMRRVGLVPFWQDERQTGQTQYIRDKMRTKRQSADQAYQQTRQETAVPVGISAWSWEHFMIYH